MDRMLMSFLAKLALNSMDILHKSPIANVGRSVFMDQQHLEVNYLTFIDNQTTNFICLKGSFLMWYLIIVISIMVTWAFDLFQATH